MWVHKDFAFTAKTANKIEEAFCQIVDEFEPVEHPFVNQIVSIDTTIRDCQASRTRYEYGRY